MLENSSVALTLLLLTFEAEAITSDSQFQTVQTSSSLNQADYTNLVDTIVMAHGGFIFDRPNQKTFRVAFLSPEQALTGLLALQQEFQMEEWRKSGLTIQVKLAFDLASANYPNAIPSFALDTDLSRISDSSENESQLLRLLLSKNKARHPYLPAKREIGLNAFLHGRDKPSQRWLENSLRFASQSGDTINQALTLSLLALLKLKQQQPEAAHHLAEESLAICRRMQNKATWWLILLVLAKIARLEGKPDKADELYRQSQTLRQELQTIHKQLDLLSRVGKVARFRGDNTVAFALFEKSLFLARSTGDKLAQAAALSNLSETAFVRRTYEKGYALLDEGIALLRQPDNEPATAALLGGAAFLLSYLGEAESARLLLEEGLNLSRALGQKIIVASLLLGLAGLEHAQNKLDVALAHYKEVVGLSWLTVDPLNLAHALWGMGEIALKQNQLPRARQLLRKSFSISLLSANLPVQALCLESLAELWAVQGRPRRAALFFGAATALHEKFELTSLPLHLTQAAHEEKLTMLRAQLGDRLLQKIFDKGKSLTPQQVFKRYQETNFKLSRKSSQSGQSVDLSANLPTLEGEMSDYQVALSLRELEVLNLVAMGLTNAQIAHRLKLSTYTIGSYLRTIYNKLGVNSRTAAASYAFKYQMKPPSPSA